MACYRRELGRRRWGLGFLLLEHNCVAVVEAKILCTVERMGFSMKYVRLREEEIEDT
jgi:hypothetical protein